MIDFSQQLAGQVKDLSRHFGQFGFSRGGYTTLAVIGGTCDRVCRGPAKILAEVDGSVRVESAESTYSSPPTKQVLTNMASALAWYGLECAWLFLHDICA